MSELPLSRLAKTEQYYDTGERVEVTIATIVELIERVGANDPVVVNVSLE